MSIHTECPDGRRLDHVIAVPHAKTLVVYFTRTGQTARIAEEIATRCNGHLDTIQLQHRGGSWLCALRYHWQALTQAEPPIQSPARNPANYDLVVVGVPVSRTGMAPPVRSYVRRYANRIKQMAFFCAEGEGEDGRGFATLSKLHGKQPVATFALPRKRLPTIASRKQMVDFVDSIRGSDSDR